jgi:transposase
MSPPRLLDDALWAHIEPLLPRPRRGRGHRAGRPRIPGRAVVTGILFVLHSGIPWSMLPREMGCGSGTTCWRRLVRWQRAGIWTRLRACTYQEVRTCVSIEVPRAVQ